MSRKLLLPLALVGVTTMGVFAASGIGDTTSDRDALAGDRERVALEVERAPAPAGAASAVTSAKKKGKKKVKIQHFVASEDIEFSDASPIVSLSCPGKAKVLSGDYATSGFVYADWFAASAAKTWEFGFAVDGGGDGVASPGITCAKGVK
jgi:hypothetical protein